MKICSIFAENVEKKGKFEKTHSYALKKVQDLKKGIIDGESFRPIFHMIEDARAIFSYPTKKELHIENAYIELIENSSLVNIFLKSWIQNFLTQS